MNANPPKLEASIVSLYSFNNAVLDAQYWLGSVYDLRSVEMLIIAKCVCDRRMA